MPLSCLIPLQISSIFRDFIGLFCFVLFFVSSELKRLQLGLGSWRVKGRRRRVTRLIGQIMRSKQKVCVRECVCQSVAASRLHLRSRSRPRRHSYLQPEREMYWVRARTSRLCTRTVHGTFLQLCKPCGLFFFFFFSNPLLIGEYVELNVKQPGCVSFIAKASFWLDAQHHRAHCSRKELRCALHLIWMKLDEYYTCWFNTEALL